MNCNNYSQIMLHYKYTNMRVALVIMVHIWILICHWWNRKMNWKFLKLIRKSSSNLSFSLLDWKIKIKWSDQSKICYIITNKLLIDWLINIFLKNFFHLYKKKNRFNSIAYEIEFYCKIEIQFQTEIPIIPVSYIIQRMLQWMKDKRW